MPVSLQIHRVLSSSFFVIALTRLAPSQHKLPAPSVAIWAGGRFPKCPLASQQSSAAALGVALCVAGDTWPAEIRLLFSARTSRSWDETQPFAGPGWPPKDDHHWAVSCYDTKETFVCD